METGGYRRIKGKQEDTGGNRGIQMIRMIQEDTEGYRSILEDTGGYR